MSFRIGYFVAEFPGQTQTWAWKQYLTLKTLGIEPKIVSTRRPPAALMSHEWTDAAQAETDYLIPFSGLDALSAIAEILLSGPMAWFRCLAYVFQAEAISWLERLRLIGLILVSGKLARLARINNWKHIHSLYCSDSAYIVMFAATLRRCTYSLTLLGQLLNFGSNQPQKWRHAAFALVMSEQLLGAVKTALGEALPAHVRIAPMGADVESHQRQTPYRPWNGEAPFRIYACGRLNLGKGYPFLLEAIAHLRQQGLPVSLQIAGEDEQGGTGHRKMLEQLIQDYHLSECVTLLGAVSEERNHQGYAEAHLFALASLEEGISVAVMEAMAMELPVVMTNVGGMAELIDDQVDGLLVPAQDAAALAAAILRVMQDSTLAFRLSQAARSKVVTKFHHQRSAEVLVQELERLYPEPVSGLPIQQQA